MRKINKLRLILWPECNRNCEGCCNKDWDVSNLQEISDYRDFDFIMLTGGEPMLNPGKVKQAIQEIRIQNFRAPIILYTASPCFSLVRLLEILNGITVSLHDQKSVADFKKFLGMLRPEDTRNKSLRLNVFTGIDISELDLFEWVVKTDIEWIENCPLPPGETLRRWKPTTL